VLGRKDFILPLGFLNSLFFLIVEQTLSDRGFSKGLCLMAWFLSAEYLELFYLFLPRISETSCAKSSDGGRRFGIVRGFRRSWHMKVLYA